MAVEYTQDNRPMAVMTALGKDALLLERFTGSESLSELFTYKLELLAPPGKTVNFGAVVGQPATVTLTPRQGTPRYINGILCRFGQAGVVRGPSGDQTFTRFNATLVPALWKLTKTHRSRIFQQISIVDVLKKVLAGLDTDFRLTGKYEPLDYVSQYKETDFAFASRTMEEEGIFYYFTHKDGKHTMVLGDSPAAHDPIPGAASLIYDDQSSGGGNMPEDRIRGWSKTQELQSGKVTLWDHCFELPPQNLESDKTTQASVAVGTVTHPLSLAGNDQFEVYDYPGRYAQRFDGIDPSGGERSPDIAKIKPDGKRKAALRMQREAAQAVAVQADGAVRTITAGHKFALDRHADGNGEYVIKKVEMWGDLRASYHNREGDGTEEFVNSFSVMPSGLPFRPQHTTPKSQVFGLQAGTVVGPKGEEIFTDKYGRVKVQFRWDREGKMDADSSCWVRVGTPWAGKQWGMVHIPRIGQEVMVAFEEGDPDRPIILGSVYNAEQMPPYKLPDKRTQSGIKSRSTLKGTPDNFNELRFEDKKGEEQVFFQAEKDHDQVVENNQTLKVGFREGGNKPDKGDQLVEVHNNRTTFYGKPHPEYGPPPDGSESVKVWNSQTLVVGEGKAQAKDGSQTTTVWKDRTTTIKTGNDTLTIEMGNQTETLKMGNRAVTLEMGNDSLTLKLGNRTTKLNLGADSTEAMQSITLKVGASKVVVDQMGVTIEGMMVKINGQIQTDIKGLMTQVTGTAMLKMGGGITMIG